MASLYLDGVPEEFRDPERAAELARLALQNSSRDRLAQKVLGFYFFETEQYEAACEFCEKVLELLPDNEASGHIGHFVVPVGPVPTGQ